ncbi:uncharacterized protein IWZ02DRAFT_487271 [Phyllosticta citriasiana]|uniref:Uncharacterized protein n=1 Tax=Phyllosticta citriasiana TaxID=595635 RepID=A0ABR1KX95_9PEZI
MKPDHPNLTLDSMEEKADSPVPGLVHRYPDKALLSSVEKNSLKPGRSRWEAVSQHVQRMPQIQDIVVSGGDSYQLLPHHIEMIGNWLISISRVRGFRFASKGLAVCPTRLLYLNDAWFNAIVAVSDKARKAGKAKATALHAHFNHPNEISWITEKAGQRLFEAGVMERNQCVLLRGVNEDIGTMSTLIRKLADNKIFPERTVTLNDAKLPLT